MGIPRFFRTPQPKKFNYVPIYYNKEKEEFEERVKAIEEEYKAEHSDTGYSPSIRRGSMRSYFKYSQHQQRKTSNFRLLIILMILVFITAYLIFGYQF